MGCTTGDLPHSRGNERKVIGTPGNPMRCERKELDMIPPGYGVICHECGETAEFDSYPQRESHAASHSCDTNRQPEVCE